MPFSIPIRNVKAASSARIWRRYRFHLVDVAGLSNMEPSRFDSTPPSAKIPGIMAQAEELARELIRRDALTEEQWEEHASWAYTGEEGRCKDVGR